MIKLEKYKLNISTVIIRTSIKSHLICLFVVLTSDGTIPKFTSIPMPIPIICSISIPILDSDSQFQL